MGLLCLVLWPAISAAHGDWRVGQAQEQLQAAGYDPGPIDGILGPLTMKALRRYQESQHLPQTGVLDEATRHVLLPGERTQTERAGPPEPGLQAPPGGAYKKIGALFQMHDFFPGLGILYVDPATVPVGPYFAYDQQGQLVSTVYMVPLKDLRAGKAFNTLGVAHAKVDHVDVYYTNGHPGVPDPHYHVVLWYISAKQAEALQ
jgi:peptidoglycan hydrolase-like protein with peptidoglycan-binding domain